MTITSAITKSFAGLTVRDLDAGQLRSSGLAPDATPVRDARVDTVMVKDPDGNSIVFAVPKDPEDPKDRRDPPDAT